VTLFFINTLNCVGDNILTLNDPANGHQVLDDYDESLCAGGGFLRNQNSNGDCSTWSVSQSCFGNTICSGEPNIEATYLMVQSATVLRGIRIPNRGRIIFMDPPYTSISSYPSRSYGMFYFAVENLGVFSFLPQLGCDNGFGFDPMNKLTGKFPWDCIPCKRKDTQLFCIDIPSFLAAQFSGILQCVLSVFLVSLRRNTN